MADDETLAKYTFVPWVRRGLGTEIAQDDLLGTSAEGGPTGRSTISVELLVAFTPPETDEESITPQKVDKDVEVVGPGDVVGIKRDAILRSFPSPDALSVNINDLAYVEFYEEDFPWRYTPAKATAEHRLTPWIALLVLKEDEFSRRPGRPGLPEILLLVPEKLALSLPPREETWAWAHVQLAGETLQADKVGKAIEDAPELALSRVLSPRRLEPHTIYYAFLVPSYETGRLAGLGATSEEIEALPAQRPAWTTANDAPAPSRPNEFPIYHSFRFTTGESEDFESLVRRLTPGSVGEDFGKRELDIGTPGYGMDGVATGSVELEGALRPPDFTRDAFPDATGETFANRLASVLNLANGLLDENASLPSHPFANAAAADGVFGSLADDPIVTPPLYGGSHAGVTEIPVATSDADLDWLRELNLDPRARVAAGAGVEVIQKRQEELMERAWRQLGELERVNGRLREAELALTTTDALFTKHLSTSEENRLLVLSAAAQAGLVRDGATVTLREEVAGSRVPSAIQAPAFRRISRPQRKLLRNLTGSRSVAGLQTKLIENVDRVPELAVSAARPRPEPTLAVSYSAVAQATDVARSEFTTLAKPKHVFIELVAANLRRKRQPQPPNPPIDLSTIDVVDFRDELHQELVPLDTGTVPKADVEELIAAIVDVGPTPTSADSAIVHLTAALFGKAFGEDLTTKVLGGLEILPEGAQPSDDEDTLGRTTTAAAITSFQGGLTDLKAEFLDARPPPAEKLPLGGVAGLAGDVLRGLAPSHTMTRRLAAAIPTLSVPAEGAPRRLRPVMAHPRFDDAEFDELRQISQDYVIPNFGDLPKNTLTLLEPNQAFIEAFMAGLNSEMARELLWREFPTDLRGTYFTKFWDTRDSGTGGGADILPMHQWKGALGGQSGRTGSFIVLVIRGELLLKFPDTFVYAQKAAWDVDKASARLLDDAGEIRLPAFRGRVEPDIVMYGFALSADEARGHRPTGLGDPLPSRPGWFFVLKERPGQVRFGMDDVDPGHFDSWDDLHWGLLPATSESPQIGLSDSPGVPTSLAADERPIWGTTSADMASLLLQNPVLYARHAAELLPPPEEEPE